MSDKPQWCWKEVDSDDVVGPFGTRDEAVESARKSLLDYSPAHVASIRFCVGRVIWPDPLAYMGDVTADKILDRMDENAWGDQWCWAANADVIFMIKDHETGEAERELGTFLEGWVKRWIEPDVWTIEDNYEEIELEVP